MVEIKLERGAWTLDDGDQLGPAGGFGEVFRGRGPSGDVAIKRLKITATTAAHREMKIGEDLARRNLEHVVPILDYGQDANSDRYYLVMPVCEFSLQEYLKECGPISWEDAKPIVLDIISGLTEASDIVHRDLKPGNVLWYNGRWRIADFGIAKFVEDSTSFETLRHSLTPAYAAPEQWLGERPTSATDVYALSCIMHTIINGRPPFGGDVDAIRASHLEEQPPILEGVPARLNSLVTHMLRKSQASRPSLARCARVLGTIDAVSIRPANLMLTEAGQQIAREEAEAETKRRIEEAAKRERKALADEAIKDLERMVSIIFDEIEAASESTNRQQQAINLGPAHLSYSQPKALQENLPLDQAPPDTGWNVVAYSSIKVRSEIELTSHSQPPSYTFSASLVYAKTNIDAEYRWRELSFWAYSSDSSQTPFSLLPTDREFWVAISHVVGSSHIAYGPLTIDAEDEEEFQRRWIELFAKAAQKKLRPPMQMPLPKTFFY